ncbi:MAG TPA: hypothetical protein VN651_00925 [Gemmatimonadaceae bacterium]|nr:hypothetical protein [Gemmatimonadaceae bacterium]
MTDTRIPSSPDAGDASFSRFTRRDFLVRAGQAGAALSIAVPGFNRAWLNDVASLGGSGGGTSGAEQQLAALRSGFRWRMLGPFRGGRTDAVTGVPGRPNEFYFGHVNGGVWKTVDGGRVWTPVFDSQPVASIGAIAVAPSAPDTVYVGSGESTLRDSVGFGNGMYKSTDAGRSWAHIGLDETQHIGKIAVDPRNPNVVFVAAIGHLYAPSAERGVFRSRDGGKSWQKVLFKNDDVGAVEVVIDPRDSQVVYAGLWNTRRPPWYTYAPTNGPGGGIYKSTDGGSTWHQLTKGLPAEGIGRTGIAIAPTNPRRVYAVVDCLVADPTERETAGGRGGANAACGPAPAPPGQGGFFRSDDAGATWTRLSADQALWGRGWYFEHVVVDPKDAETVYVSNVSVSRTMDGGKTWVPLRGSPGGDDYHQPWVSPDDSNTVIVASDQGTVITRNARAEDPREVTWSSWLNQPTAQLYHISVDYRFPYWVTGAQQDSGAVAVCSRGKFGEISMRDWEPIGAGGESGYTAGDPLHPGIIFGGSGQRYDLALNQPMPGTTAPRTADCARTDWTQPLVFSTADPRALYYSNQYLFKSTDGAKTWSQISNDLTRPDPGVPATLDAAAAAQVDRNGKRGVIYTVAPSPVLVPMVWAGTDDGLIQVTRDDGKTWDDVTPAALTPWSRVTMIQASHFDQNAAYASVDRHQLQDFEPYIYRTRDLGKTWQRITTGLPAGVYVHTIKEDHARQGLLFAGTERGAFMSFDDGDHWQPIQLNLPVTSVRDFQIYGNDLIVGSHGRGIWVIDDISPLRQITDAVLASDAFLFKPADAIAVEQGGDNGTPLQKDEPQAENPPNGAIIDYYLKQDATGPVSIEILDAGGAVVQTFSTEGSPVPLGGRGGRGGRGGGIPNTTALWRVPPAPFSSAAGMHRVVWLPVAGGGRGGRGGGRGGGLSFLTGNFTAKLNANGKSYTQSFAVHPDPRGHIGSPAIIER